MKVRSTRFQIQNRRDERKHTRRRRNARTSTADLSTRICKIVQRLTSEGKAEIRHAAVVAGMSGRTLQRRLAGSGTDYSRLVDAVRLARAIALIDDPSTKLADVARALGYSDAPNFTRAFRRWTGLCPSQFRKMSHKSRGNLTRMKLESMFGRRAVVWRELRGLIQQRTHG